MRKLLYGLGAAGIALWAQFGEVAPSEAAIIYPWCAHYGGRMGAPELRLCELPAVRGDHRRDGRIL